MKLQTEEIADIPDNVTITTDKKCIIVKGPKGVLKRTFKGSSAGVSVEGKQIKVSMWFGKKMEACVVRTICSHIKNMITGVTVGFKQTMRVCYSHFQMTLVPDNKKHILDIKQWLGNKASKLVRFPEGVKVTIDGPLVIVNGSSLEEVSLTCSNISQATAIRGGKDIRKFLDGVQVIKKGHEIEED